MKEKNKNYYLKKKLSNETKQPKQTLSMTNSAIKRRKERKSKKEKREKETKRKQSYRKSAKETAVIEQISLYRKTFANRTEKSRALKKLKQSLPLTPNRRTAVMASYLSSKKSPTVSNLEKMNVVVTPEDKNDIHLGKAVIHDLREIVDKTKLLRTDGARTAISIITASTNGSNVQNEKKKVLLGKK
ncbi:unnamed protein product [Mytilus coruscus]|uniref:Uncharacterized protein n=1 Tax=Mytilus coruscus TaxID=42192 RepID=A0A6J8DC92_MYTCO|nr:unnamed protein product [Mytilus coruscus]